MSWANEVTEARMEGALAIWQSATETPRLPLLSSNLAKTVKKIHPQSRRAFNFKVRA